MRYRVYGFTDDEPIEEQLLFTTETLDEAISNAEVNPMATAVVDNETDEEVWTNWGDL
jgi:hypothetical protein